MVFNIFTSAKPGVDSVFVCTCARIFVIFSECILCVTVSLAKNREFEIIRKIEPVWQETQAVCQSYRLKIIHEFQNAEIKGGAA